MGVHRHRPGLVIELRAGVHRQPHDRATAVVGVAEARSHPHQPVGATVERRPVAAQPAEHLRPRRGGTGCGRGERPGQHRELVEKAGEGRSVAQLGAGPGPEPRLGRRSLQAPQPGQVQPDDEDPHGQGEEPLPEVVPELGLDDGPVDRQHGGSHRGRRVRRQRGPTPIR